MLVGTLEVDVRRILKLGTELTDGLPRDARIPPHIEDVTVGLEVMPAALGAGAGIAKVLSRLVGKPGIGALGVEELNDGVERSIVHDLLAAVGAGVARNRHAPVTLTADAPVGTLLDHGADAVGGMRRIPLDMFTDLIARGLTKTRLVHGDEPLVGGAEKHRLLAAPAVRIAVRDLLLEHKRTALAEELDDMRVGLVGVHAAEGAARAESLTIVEVAVVIDRHANIGDTSVETGKIVVNTMSRRIMDDTGAVVGADVLGEQGNAFDAVEDGLLVVEAGKSLSGTYVILASNLDRRVIPAKELAALRGECLEHDLGAALVLHSHVGSTWLQGNGLVGRDGPGGRRPNDEIDRTIEILKASGLCRQLETNENGRRGLIGVLDLGFGKSGVAMFAPVNGLMPAVHQAFVEHGLEDLDISSIVLVIQRQIGIIPIAEHTQTTETCLLQLDVLNSKLIAELADLGRGGLVELLGTELLLNLMLNGLTVAIPTGDVRDLATLHHPVTVDHVFRDLVHGVTDVDRTVGVRRTVMKHKLLVTLVLLQNLLVDLVVLPVLKPFGLGLGKTGSHGEPGLRQVHGLLVLVCHEYPFPVANALAPLMGTKKAPVPKSWDEAP